MATERTVGPTAQAVQRRDVRVDRLGFVKAVTAWGETLKAKIKGDMQPGDTFEGDYFVATVSPVEESEVSPSALLKLLEGKTISRTQFVECLTVKASEVGKLGLPLPTLRRLVRKFQSTPRLNVKPKKDVKLEVADAIRELSETTPQRLVA
jgi:hypothetical protein